MFRDPIASVESTRAAPATAATASSSVRSLRVGLIGTGTVGAGTVRVLARNQALIAARAGRGIEVVIACARNLQRAAVVVGPQVPLTEDPLQVATHPDVDVLVEVAGGSTEAALGWVLAAMAAGKHVVTANKALLAVHGDALWAAARQHGVTLAYEGAVAVSIPILKTLHEGLTANHIEWVAGIINGTSNFVLSQMRDHGQGLDAALAQAQALGYAEADLQSDLDGTDAAHKITLLAAHAFGQPARLADVQVEGLQQLQPLDLACAEQLGYRIKPLAVARRRCDARGQDAVELRVQPALVPASHLMAQVHGVMNGVMVKADAAGLTMYYGAGAGAEPTASAVIADLVDLARRMDTYPAQTPRTAQAVPPCTGAEALPAQRTLKVLPRAAVRTRHYLRIPVQTAQHIEAVGGWLAAQQVPVQQVALASDKLLPAGSYPQVLVLTDVVAQSAIGLAAHALAVHPVVAGPVVTLRVETLEG